MRSLPLLILLVVGVGLSTGGLMVQRRDHLGFPIIELIALGLVPVVATAVTVMLFVVHGRSGGASYYYVVKFMAGAELVLAATVPTTMLVIVGRLPHVVRRARVTWPRLLCPAAVLLALFFFGPLHDGPGPVTDSGTCGSGQSSLPTTDIAAQVLVAARQARGGAAFERTVVIDRLMGHAPAVQPDAWFHALTDSSTARTVLRARQLADNRDHLAPAESGRGVVQARSHAAVVLHSVAANTCTR